MLNFFVQKSQLQNSGWVSGKATRRSRVLQLAQKINILLLLALCISGSLIGCGGSVTQYYVLDTTATKQMEGVVNLPSIAIRQLEIPPYLDRPRMVSRDHGSELHISEYHQWGGRLRDNLARTLADDLGVELASPNISAVPQPGAMDADISLLVDIRQFERLPDGHVHLKVRWQIQQTGSVVQSHLNYFSSSTRMDSDDYAGMAQAMSSLLSRLSRNMAKAILRISAAGAQ